MVAQLKAAKFTVPCPHPDCDYIARSNSALTVARGQMFKHIRANHNPKFSGRSSGGDPVDFNKAIEPETNGSTGRGRLVPVVDSRGAQVGVREVVERIADRETYTKEEMEAVLAELGKYKRALRIFQE